MNPAYGFFGWVVVGVMAGAIGGRISAEEDGGLASVITGLVGAVAGGLVTRAAFGAPTGTAGLLGSLAGALLGAALFVFVARKVARLGRPPRQAGRLDARTRVTRSST